MLSLVLSILANEAAAAVWTASRTLTILETDMKLPQHSAEWPLISICAIKSYDRSAHKSLPSQAEVE